MNDDTLQQIQELAAETFEVPASAVTLQSSPDTVPNWDSLQHLNFILALETKFQIEFTAEEMEAVRSVADAVAIVEKKQTG